MIYSLAFLSFFFSWTVVPCPMYYKLGFCAAFLLMVTPRYDFKLQPLHWLLIGWLVWCGICCWNSAYPVLSWVGYHLRVEGFLTWIVMASLAYFYWRVTLTETFMQLGCALTLLLTLILNNVLSDEQFQLIAFTPVALGSLCAVMAVTLYSIGPWMTVFIIPFIALSNNRSGLIAAIASLMVFIALRTGFKRFLRIGGVFALLAGLIVICSPLKTKFAHISPSSMGSGARPQWILQAEDLSMALPVTGFGLDTLSKYLKPVASLDKYGSTPVADKTHYLPYDIILMTGWIGYALFLAMAGVAVWIGITYRTERNVLCLSILTGWFVFGLFNPQGCYSTFIAIWAVFGLREGESE